MFLILVTNSNSKNEYLRGSTGMQMLLFQFLCIIFIATKNTVHGSITCLRDYFNKERKAALLKLLQRGGCTV